MEIVTFKDNDFNCIPVNAVPVTVSLPNIEILEITGFLSITRLENGLIVKTISRLQCDIDNKSVLDHLRLLLNYVNSVYVSVLVRLIEFLVDNDIIYDLLWILFKSNSIVYTRYVGTKKSRYIKLDFIEERVIKQRMKYFYVKDYYLDSDDKVFDESRIVMDIEKFRKVKLIYFFIVFSFKYYSETKKIKKYVTEYDKKFIKLIRLYHYRYCHDLVFYIHYGELILFNIKDRITIDTIFFYQNNFDYEKSNINKLK